MRDTTSASRSARSSTPLLKAILSTEGTRRTPTITAIFPRTDFATGNLLASSSGSVALSCRSRTLVPSSFIRYANLAGLAAGCWVQGAPSQAPDIPALFLYDVGRMVRRPA
ncbi:MAG: hypothetical protein JWO49_1184 [Arthrobacter sp.]|nr:hypothetical protein [Arthrobacter sp.]